MEINLFESVYDIKEFMKHHPGGSDIFKNAEGLKDLTPLFYSYHCLSDIKKIKSILEKYKKENKTSEYLVPYTYKEEDFYSVLCKRVSNRFKNRNTKATPMWYFKIFITLLIMIFNYSFINTSNSLLQIFLGIIHGLCIISLAFNILHDASHFAISKNSETNKTISRIIQCVILWNHHIWFRHHVYAHHSFTGVYPYDVDTKNFKPLVIKSIQSEGNGYINFFTKHQGLLSIFFMAFLPGQYLAQVYIYASTLYFGTLWSLPIKKNLIIDNFYEIFIYFGMVYWYYKISIYKYFFISLITTANFVYYMCIGPDHDTFESTIENHESKNMDWGELQVRRSGNFSTNYDIVCHIFGGINYQIEHHLFPGVSHMHYKEISVIVKQTCKEFNIPYNDLSWYESLLSCIKTYKYNGSNHKKQK